MVIKYVAPALVALAISGAGSALAKEASPACKLVKVETATVTAIVDGDTVRLDDGSQVRLVGTQAPKLPLGRKNYPTWPLAEEAKSEISELILGEEVQLRYGGARKDRHGRRLAHLFRTRDNLWVQGEMIARGFARTYSFSDNRGCVRALQDKEAKARSQKRGIWGLDYYKLHAALKTGPLLAKLNTFQLVEGRISDVAEVRGRVFLNFGKNYRDDFTAVISRGDVRRFAKSKIDLMKLKGARVRVRGWIERHNGPSIDVTHPEQIEVLD